MDRMGYFDEIFGSSTDSIRETVTTAFVRSYEENVHCFDESLGHTSLVYGFMVRATGLMYLAQSFDEMDGVRVVQSGNLFNVVFDDARTMHFYKYPDMESAKFDRSRVRRNLVSENQLSLFNETIGTRPVSEARGLGRHLVVVHQGNPYTGLRSIDVGAPVNMAVDGTQWLWRENLHTAPVIELAPPEVAAPAIAGYAELPVPELTLDLTKPRIDMERSGEDGS